MSFLPKGYEAPKTEGGYYKLQKGENRFRIMSPAVVGYEYWNTSNKPVRSKEGWEETPADMREDSKIKWFWAFVVYNYEVGKPQIMEITQKTIQSAIEAYTLNEKWGDPTKYDLVITRTGDGLETEYTVIAEPHSPAPKADISKIDLESLFAGADPFEKKEAEDPLEGESPF